MNHSQNLGERMWHLYKTGGVTPAIASMFGSQSAQQMAFIRSLMKEQRNNSLYDIPLKEINFVVFDLETTGFSPYHGDEIISFGAVVVEGCELKEAECFHSVVNPKRTIPPDIECLTGITNDMAARAPELIDVLRQFLEFVQQRVLISHGSGHDKHFLNSALWKTSKVNLTHRLIDTMIVAKRLHPNKGEYGLDSLLEYYGIQTEGRHHALEDARMTAALWMKLAEELRQLQVNKLGELYVYLSRR
jgi:DNA polymerase-3 subunit epsilon